MREPGERQDKSQCLTRRALGEAEAATLFEWLQRLDDENDLTGLGGRN
jgi:hypothetical protein